jgi:Ca2+-dependent lipid-binding protein
MAKECGSSSVIVGVVKVKVVRGTNLAVRDVFSSDPYVVLKLGNQEVRTRTVRKNTNPVWNEDLTLIVQDLNHLLVTLVRTFQSSIDRSMYSIVFS